MDSDEKSDIPLLTLSLDAEKTFYRVRMLPIKFLKSWLDLIQAGFKNFVWKEAEGGVITNHHHAEYLFSSDASHHDTQRIFHSLEYLENKATVFHASFLQVNSNSKTKNVAYLGHFILPPVCLQEDIKRKIGSFTWEQNSTTSVQQVSIALRNGLLELDSRASEEVTCHALQNYPVNNMFTGYISIDEMKTFSGELHDFTPNTAEYSAFCVQEDNDIFSEVEAVQKPEKALPHFLVKRD
ncbi:telomere repeats-binding bouquet formation protein 2 [Rhinophrynus dorsalis]